MALCVMMPTSIVLACPSMGVHARPLYTWHSPPHVKKGHQSSLKVRQQCYTCTNTRARSIIDVHGSPHYKWMCCTPIARLGHGLALANVLSPACSMHIKLPQMLTCHATMSTCTSTSTSINVDHDEVLVTWSLSPPTRRRRQLWGTRPPQWAVLIPHMHMVLNTTWL